MRVHAPDEWQASDNDGWVPIDFTVGFKDLPVQWIELGRKSLSEPFLEQTLEALRSAEPPAREKRTDLNALLEMAARLPPVTPAGVIFHVSRCGSTLVSNACRMARGATVLSEPQPVCVLFQPDIFQNSVFADGEHEAARRKLLDCVTRVYAHASGQRQPKLVIKCNPLNTLNIRLVRALWPDVPFLVMIRDPVEVIVSVLAKWPGWISFKGRRALSCKLFGWTGEEFDSMTMYDYCARVIGGYCQAATEMIGPDCKLIDYANLNLTRIYQIAEFFGLEMPPAGSDDVQRVISAYSKEPNQARRFERDETRKQQEATVHVREAVQRSAWSAYQSLKQLESWSD
jgi:hypothetical protein